MTNRVPLMAGNWKMNLDHLEANHLVQGLAMALQDDNHDYTACEVLVLPPFTDIRTVQTIVDADDLDIKYGAQDVSVHDNGAYTGEVSASMLTKLGCTYVVVGHSERREYHGESDALVGAKARKTLDTGMIPIMCCGEALEVRRAGTHVEFVLGQIRAALKGWSAGDVARIVIAYEPIWAIGTGETATAADAQEVCSAIREALRIDYGHHRRRRPHPVRRIGQARQHQRAHGSGRRRRRPCRRCLAQGRFLRRHGELLRLSASDAPVLVRAPRPGAVAVARSSRAGMAGPRHSRPVIAALACTVQYGVVSHRAGLLIGSLIG